MEKRCKDCGVIKPIEEFYKFERMKSGYFNICKKCMNVRNKKYRDSHRENIKKIMRSHRTKRKAYAAFGKVCYQVFSETPYIFSEKINKAYQEIFIELSTK